MRKPVLSSHFESRTPSDVRLAQMKYDERKTKPQAVINVGIGNVSLPTNPAMQKECLHLMPRKVPLLKVLSDTPVLPALLSARMPLKTYLIVKGSTQVSCSFK